MNKHTILTTLLLFLLLNSYTLKAQEDVLQKFADNMKTGNAAVLLQSISEQVEININGNRQSVSNAQSESILKGFMSKHPMSRFEYKHQGASGKSGYAVGKYTDAEGKSFRFIIKTDGQKIEKIDVSPE